MSDTGKAEGGPIEFHEGGRSTADATMAVALGLVALLVGLGATMAGAWIAYWNSAALMPFASGLVGPEPDVVSLYLVVSGTVTTILGGLSIYRSQDM
jgi:hypothetical protein